MHRDLSKSIKATCYYHLKPGPSKVCRTDRCFSFSFFLFGSGKKHFHILRVSSAPAESTVEPSGDMAKFRIRFVCPVSSATLRGAKLILNINLCFRPGTNYEIKTDLQTLVIEGYFQIIS